MIHKDEARKQQLNPAAEDDVRSLGDVLEEDAEAYDDYDAMMKKMTDSSTAAWSATQFQIKKEDGALRSPNLLSQSWFGKEAKFELRKTQDTLCN